MVGKFLAVILILGTASLPSAHGLPIPSRWILAVFRSRKVLA